MLHAVHFSSDRDWPIEACRAGWYAKASPEAFFPERDRYADQEMGLP